MKRLIIAYSLMCLIIAAITFSLIYNYQTKKQMTALLDSVYQSAEKGDIPAATQGVKQFLNTWNKKEKILILVLHHNKTDEINLIASEFEAYISLGEIPEFCASVKKVISLLDHMWETEQPSLKNIL